MTKYVALLRGINVGSKNRIKMDALRTLMESLGVNNVQTYIQSGNVVFESAEEKVALQSRIESEIEREFGFSVNVVLRTAEELKQISESCPFTKKEIQEAESMSEGESLYVAFLQDVPLEDSIVKLNDYTSKSEEIRIKDKEIYLLFRQSIRNSKLANNLPKLGVPSTVRNWKTVTKLVEMSKAEEI
ncbi:DUF1697 domain-containing protein [Cytobacillus sp. FJAT-54145]|uniref:DUF1697 domain-containing protein n=1 Tax=Cytobacillus spartinae TaxID=3299023 RepID=A0ABW6KBW6_9BACI